MGKGACHINLGTSFDPGTNVKVERGKKKSLKNCPLISKHVLLHKDTHIEVCTQTIIAHETFNKYKREEKRNM